MPSNVTCNVIEKFFDKRKSFESNLRSPKIHSTYLILCLYIYLFIAIIIKKSTSFIMYKSSQNTFYFMNYIQYSRTSIVMRLKDEIYCIKNPENLSEFNNCSTKNVTIITNCRYFYIHELQDLQSLHLKKICFFSI